jgi:hypothetical protein
MKSMQVDLDGELGKEGREREILTDGLNQHMGIFGYRK